MFLSPVSLSATRRHRPTDSTDAASSITSSSSGNEVSSAVDRAGLVTNELVTGVVLGTDSTGHTTYSLALAESLTINPTATAADTTLSAAGTSFD